MLVPHCFVRHSPDSGPSQDELDKSLALELLLSEREGKGENAISVIWNMRDNIKYVQNLMSYVLNAIETYKNLLNWSETDFSTCHSILFCVIR